MGPPGSKRKEYILTLAENFEDFKYEVICVGDLLNKEISKKSDLGKKIIDARKSDGRTYSFAPDEIVIDLVTKQIEQLEKDKKNWIIEGFPRTRKQALSLTKMEFIPDRMILLDVSETAADEGEKYEEYNTHIEGVKDIYAGMISVVDGNKHQDVILQEIARILKLKSVNAPRRAPKIVLVGVPGSGKTTQAIKLAEKLKIVHVQASSLLKNKVNEGTDEGKEIWRCLRDGEPVADEVFNNIIKQRLDQLDVKMNGFVLDGYPLNGEQMRFLLDS